MKESTQVQIEKLPASFNGLKLRIFFLEKVPVHRAIMEMWERRKV